MGERRQLGLVVGAGLAIGLVTLILITAVGPFFAGSLTVSSYEAALHDNGTLSEQYTYNVASSGQYPHALSRVGGSAFTQQHSTVYPGSIDDSCPWNYWLR